MSSGDAIICPWKGAAKKVAGKSANASVYVAAKCALWQHWMAGISSSIRVKIAQLRSRANIGPADWMVRGYLVFQRIGLEAEAARRPEWLVRESRTNFAMGRFYSLQRVACSICISVFLLNICRTTPSREAVLIERPIKSRAKTSASAINGSTLAR